jgi:hypothetical protein
MKMPKGNSTILLHADRARIEYDLARGMPVRAVSKKYDVTIWALYRFKRKLPPQLRAAALGKQLKAGAELDALRTSESESILQNLGLLRARLFLQLDAAMEANDARLVVAISDALSRNIALTGKYLGEFAAHSVQTSINVLISAEYLDLRTDLLRALAPYPDARRAVGAALHAREAKMAGDYSKAAAPAAAPLLIEGSAEHEVVADA